MVFGMGGDRSISIGVTSSGFNEAQAEARAAGAGLRAFGEAARDAIIPTRMFGKAADEAGDEASEAGAEAAAGAAGFASFGASSEGLNARLGFVSGSLGTIVPLMVALGSALVPVLTLVGASTLALGGLATAFGAVIGSGIIAYGSGLEDQLANLKEELESIIKPFGEQFIPLIDSAIGAFPTFVRNVLDAIGPLDMFVEALQEMGAIAMRVIPELLGFLVDFGREVLPIFMDLFRSLMNGLVPAFRALAESGMDVGATLSDAFGVIPWIAESIREVSAATGPLRREFTRLAVTVIDGALKVINEFIDSLDALLPAFTPAVEALRFFASVVLDTMESTVGHVLDEAIRVFLKLGDTVSLIVGDILRAFGLLGPGTQPAIRELVRLLEGDLHDAITFVADIIIRDLKTIQQTWTQHKSTVIGAIRPVVKAIQSLFDIIVRILKPFQRFSEEITQAALIVGGIIGTIWAVTTAVSALGTVLGVAAGAVGLLTSPILLLTGLIAALLIAWRTNFWGIRDITEQIVAKLRTFLSPFIDWLKRAFRQAVQLVKRAWDRYVPPLLTSAREVFGKIRELVNQYWPEIRRIIELAVKVVKKAWDTFIVPLIADARRVFGKILEVAAPLWNRIEGVITDVMNFIAPFFETHLDAMLVVAKAVLDGIKGYFEFALDTIKTVLKVALAAMDGDWSRVLDLIKGYVTDTFNGIINFIKRWGSRWLSFIERRIIQPAIGFFRDLYDRLVGGSIVPNMFSDIMGAARAFVGNFTRSFNRAKNRVLGKVRSMKRNAIDAVENLISGMKDAASGWVDEFLQPFKDAKKGAEDTVGGLKEEIVGNSIIPDMFSETVDEGESWMPQFMSPIASARDEVAGQFEQMRKRAAANLPIGAVDPRRNLSLRTGQGDDGDRRRGQYGLYIESMRIEASSREEGREAADGFVAQLRRRGFTRGY